MANALYDKGRDRFATADIDWVDDTINVYLVDTDDYTVDLENDEFVDDVPSAAREASVALSGKSTDGTGVCDADDATFTSVSGDECEALVIAKDTGDESTSPLIAYIDDATGLPATPTGGDIVVEWDDGSNKIFKL